MEYVSVVVCYSVLQCHAVCCSGLQCIAVCCSVFLCVVREILIGGVNKCCSVLQFVVAVCMLQYVVRGILIS